MMIKNILPQELIDYIFSLTNIMICDKFRNILGDIIIRNMYDKKKHTLDYIVKNNEKSVLEYIVKKDKPFEESEFIDLVLTHKNFDILISFSEYDYKFFPSTHRYFEEIIHCTIYDKNIKMIDYFYRLGKEKNYYIDKKDILEESLGTDDIKTIECVYSLCGEKIGRDSLIKNHIEYEMSGLYEHCCELLENKNKWPELYDFEGISDIVSRLKKESFERYI